MELKVWVEGIQRVVCGANYSTTCQDVVLALAHAMGRTGRFTLVERWRDSERPLSPSECPLQALHKWGEYAAEVRFFLIQADSNGANTGNSNNGSGGGINRNTKDADRGPEGRIYSARPKSQIRDNEEVPNRPRDVISHLKAASGMSHTSSPRLSPRAGAPVSSRQASQKQYNNQLNSVQQHEHLKRSSTFSGAHNYAPQPPFPPSSSRPNNPTVPSSLSSHLPSTQQYSSLPYHTQQNQHHQPSSSYSSSAQNPSSQNLSSYHNQHKLGSKPHSHQTRNMPSNDRTSLVPPLTNGSDPGMSSYSSSNSSPRSPSGRTGGQSQQIPSGQSSHARDGLPLRSDDSHDMILRDFREHPSGKTPHDMSTSSSGFAPRPRNLAGSEQTPQYLDSRQRQMQRERMPRSPGPRRSDFASQQQQSQLAQQEQGPHGQSHPGPHSNHEHQAPEPHAQHSHPYPNPHRQKQQFPQSHQHREQPGLPSSHLQESFPTSSPPSSSPTPPVPAPRHRTRPSPEPVEYENIAYARGRNQRINHQQPQQEQQFEQHQQYQQPKNAPSPRRRERSQSRDRHGQKSGGFATNTASTAMGSKAVADALPSPHTSGGVPMWSQAGRGDSTATSQQQQLQYPRDPAHLSRSLPTSGMNLLRRSDEAGRNSGALAGSVDFVESAVKRQQLQQQQFRADAEDAAYHLARAGDHNGRRSKPQDNVNFSGDTANRSMSSFASAVANIRQHSRERSPREAGLEGAGKASSSRFLGEPVTREPIPSSSSGRDQAYPVKEQPNNRYNVTPNVPSEPNINQHPQHDSHVNRSTPSHAHLPHSNNAQNVPSPREPASPASITLSPRRNSAFKEVSPRHSFQPSPSSPPGSAFSFDYSKPHPGPHSDRDLLYQPPAQEPAHPRESARHELPSQAQEDSLHLRQASLEVEEYDLDQNFPDISHRDRDFSIGAPARLTGRDSAPRQGTSSTDVSAASAANFESSTPLEYRLDSGGVRPAPHRAEAEYLQLARLVSVQLDRLKVIEAQIADTIAEISTLEEETSHTDFKLQELAVDGAELKTMEEELTKEEAELERVEWDNVLDGEQKREADIRRQMANLEVQVKNLKEKMERLKEEEERKTEDIKTEKEKQAAEIKEKIKLEKEATAKVQQLTSELKQMDVTLENQRKAMEKLDSELSEAERNMKEQDKLRAKVETELKEENLKDFHAYPVTKEPLPSVTTLENFIVPHSGYKKAKPYTSTSSDTVDDDTEDSAPDTGEAIIKILEGRLSPSSPLSGELNKVGAMTSAQQTYKSALAAKNPNGVWV
ncbi:doublecortin domain-containing protein 5 [Plakobranchus ocellatus]|uniref:Doublecortin domain-containing protein 5 n=1 Tax=Plakobranchus ocellatus TaxID=259542 RepID=A0AAV3Z0Z5_9GAST|nr:doublecortin domain-containing protein 5 [Plakobranchus ocellatus]